MMLDATFGLIADRHAIQLVVAVASPVAKPVPDERPDVRYVAGAATRAEGMPASTPKETVHAVHVMGDSTSPGLILPGETTPGLRLTCQQAMSATGIYMLALMLVLTPLPDGP